jgi:uncharacterized DUF497 family protein
MDTVEFDWDQVNTGHIARHGVTPDEVGQVFVDDEMDIDYAVVGEEERWTVIGQTHLARVLIVVFTMRGDLVRTVTAYEASSRMHAEYFANKGQ